MFVSDARSSRSLARRAGRGELAQVFRSLFLHAGTLASLDSPLESATLEARARAIAIEVVLGFQAVVSHEGAALRCGVEIVRPPEPLLGWMLRAHGFTVETQFHHQVGTDDHWADTEIVELDIVIEFDGKGRYGTQWGEIPRRLSAREDRDKDLESSGLRSIAHRERVRDPLPMTPSLREP